MPAPLEDEYAEIVVKFKLATKRSEIHDSAMARSAAAQIAGMYQDELKEMFGDGVQVGPPKYEARVGSLIGTLSTFVLGSATAIGPVLLCYEQPDFLRALIGGLARRKFGRPVHVPWVRRKIIRSTFAQGVRGPSIVVADDLNHEKYGWVRRQPWLSLAGLVFLGICGGVIALEVEKSNAQKLEILTAELRQISARLDNISKTLASDLEAKIAPPTKIQIEYAKTPSPGCVTIMQGAHSISRQCPP